MAVRKMSRSWRTLSYCKSLNILQYFSRHPPYSHPIRTFENPFFSFYLANNAYSSTLLPTIHTFIKFSLKKSDGNCRNRKDIHYESYYYLLWSMIVSKWKPVGLSSGSFLLPFLVCLISCRHLASLKWTITVTILG